ncbi:MAG: LarC family nickel insertion protein [Candidatus Omnitrophota bacterium]
MKLAYFDCFWGISGDMILASLLDAGLNPSLFLQEFKKAKLPPFELKLRKVKKEEILATQIEIKAKNKKNFSFLDFKKIIKQSRLPLDIKKKVLNTFITLAEVEKKIHGVKGNDFCFEQLGELDTLVDVAGTYIALDLLNIEKVYFSRLRVARGGFFKHGNKRLPLPGPAVLELLKDIPLEFIEEPYEYITPTGAVLVKSLYTPNLPHFKILKIGYGAGSINFGSQPNLLRVIIGESSPLTEV